ncbi:hypothetical protein ACHAWX_006434 [Stephanocyclus meneghinianus]
MNGNNPNRVRPTAMLPPRRCPYATLNLPDHRHERDRREGSSQKEERVSDEKIRDAYKRLSRHLHPDKFPPGRPREDAQEIFTELMNAYEILSDPVLRQAYDHFGHHAVAIVRHNRYGSSSLYRTLSDLHRRGKTWQALELLSSLLENVAREKRRNEWRMDADVEVALHLNPKGCQEWIDVVETNVGFTATVPMPVPIASEYAEARRRDERTLVTQNATLAVGGRTGLERGLGYTRGTISASYQPTKQTHLSSEVSMGRKHFDTSFTAIRSMVHGTLVSAKVTRHHGDDGRLSLGFSSSRSLSLIPGRPDTNAMFALNFGLDPPAKLQIQYGYLAITTWGLWTHDNTDDDDDDQEDDRHRAPNDDDAYAAKDDCNESDAQSTTSSNKTRRTGDRVDPKYDHHPPKITAKLTMGQFPIELAIEQSHLLDSPQRSIEASIAYNPFRGTFSIKSMLSREVSSDTTYSIGLSHVGRNGLTWMFRYQRHELTLSVPIFVQHYLSPRYWNTLITLSIISFLMDETWGEMMGSEETTETANAFDAHHETIAVKDRTVLKELQWMNSIDAKSNSSDQMAIMEHIGKAKMEYERARNGLVVLKATYALSNTQHSHAEKTDVTMALQFWVCDSRLLLPSGSKKMLLGFYDVSPPHRERYDDEHRDASIWHEVVDRMNALLAYFGIGHAKYQYNEDTTNKDGRDANLREDDSQNNVTPKLTIRYRYRGIVFEIELDDDQAESLPSQNAFVLGSGKILC